MSQISRSLTESEKKDCIDIRDRSPDKVFLTRVRIAEGEHNKEKNGMDLHYMGFRIL